MRDQQLMALVDRFASLPEVEAIALAGSHSVNMNDALSDYDVYLYINQVIPVETREEITHLYCSYMEVNNQFWETEDDGVLKCGTEIELIYRDLDWLDRELNKVVFEHQASVGYSTCFWANLSNSHILFDRNGRLAALQDKYQQDYPAPLIQAIISKNLPLLKQAMPAYPKQISKALKRRDHVSVHHRVTEYLASYFDVLFAINAIPHPGEKRLVKYALENCSQLPENFESTIADLLSLAGQQNEDLLPLIEQASSELEALI